MNMNAKKLLYTIMLKYMHARNRFMRWWAVKVKGGEDKLIDKEG